MTPENEVRFNRTLEIRNADLELQHQKCLTKSDLINEAVAFYYDYIVGYDGDIRINKLYEAELKSVMKNYMKPIYSMYNGISYQQMLLIKELNIIFNELNQWPDEEDIRSRYTKLFSLDDLVRDIEKKRLQTKDSDVDE